MQVYLAEPIEINGIKVQHTPAGLKYLIAHYGHILQLPLTPQQLSNENRQYIEKLIENYNIHLQLYENERAAKTTGTSLELPHSNADDGREETIPNDIPAHFAGADAGASG